MAGSLWHHRRKRSGSGNITAPPVVVVDDHDNLGCMPNILQFLGSPQRHRARKMLTYHKHRTGKGKTPKLEEVAGSTSEVHDHLDKDANLLVKSNDDATTKTDPAAVMRTVIGKRKSQNGHKREVSKFSRTFSIHHHLENDDYSLQNELTSDNENEMTKDDLHERGSNRSQDVPEVSERVTTMERYEACGSMDNMLEIDKKQLDEFTDHLDEKKLPTHETFPETKESLSKFKAENSIEVKRDLLVDQPKEFLDMMELLNTNKELFLKIVRDPMFAKYVQSQQASSSAAALEKSVSFPAPRLCTGDLWTQKLDGRTEREQIFSKKRERSQCERSSLEDDGQNMVSTIGGDDNTFRSEVAPSDSPEPCFEVLKNHKNTRNASRRFKGLKQKLKDIIKENNQENKRILMDGILNKVPRGQKISENVKKEIPGCWQGKHNNYGSKSKLTRIGSLPPNNNYKLRSMKRSPSLVESLDRYSLLFEKTSSREFKRSPDMSTLHKENNDLQSKTKSRTLEKTFSLPDLQSYTLSKNAKSDTPDHADSRISSNSSFATGNITSENYSFVQLESGVNGFISKQPLDPGKVMEYLTEEGVRETADGTEEEQILTNDQEKLETCKISEASTQERSSFSCLREGANVIPTISNSIDGTYNQEQSLDPLQISSTQAGITLDPLQGELEELEFSDAPPPSEENIEDDFYDEPSPEKLDDMSILPIHVDEKDSSEFQYVKNILWKSGFSAQYALGEWYSIDQPVDPLLFEEAECSPHGLDVDNNIETTIYHMLLFDLINEVLLEIHDTSSSRSPWISYVDHIRRPLPVGDNVLEEVWAIIRQYLNSQSELDPTIESIVARDFKKSDGWMNLRHDTEIIELQLEDLILDDLIDEVLDSTAYRLGNITSI